MLYRTDDNSPKQRFHFQSWQVERSHSRVSANVEKAGASDPDDPGDFDRGGRHHDLQ